MSRAWAIKLGSGGRCVPFCEKQKIVGVGWRTVDPLVLTTATRADLTLHVTQRCAWYRTPREVGGAVGQLYRFSRECAVGDFVLYYVPSKKHVVVTRVVSGCRFRDFDIDQDVDIWHYRRVEYPVPPIPLLDLYGPLKGRLLGPRMSFWELRDPDAVAQIAAGRWPSLVTATDPRIREAYRHLRDLVLKRMDALTDHDWEWLTVDYFKQLGAQIDERAVGGTRAIIDVEARFEHGDFSELWRIQVKHYQGPIGWNSIGADLAAVGEARLCYVSTHGFSVEAREKADENEVRLLEAKDFVWLVLSGKLRHSLREKLRVPSLESLAESIEETASA